MYPEPTDIAKILVENNGSDYIDIKSILINHPDIAKYVELTIHVPHILDDHIHEDDYVDIIIDIFHYNSFEIDRDEVVKYVDEVCKSFDAPHDDLGDFSDDEFRSSNELDPRFRTILKYYIKKLSYHSEKVLEEFALNHERWSDVEFENDMMYLGALFNMDKLDKLTSSKLISYSTHDNAHAKFDYSGHIITLWPSPLGHKVMGDIGEHFVKLVGKL